MPNTGPEQVAGVLEVAVGVVLNEAGEVLIAQRAAHQHKGGLWEFPGGKIEAGEQAEAALCRELAEEVGLKIEACAASTLLDIRHDYPERSVLLRVFVVRAFRGEAHGREGQEVRWVQLDALDAYAFPEANAPIIGALRELLN